MGNKLVTRVRNVFGKKSKSETRAIETAKVKKMTTRSIQTPESHSVPDIVAEKQSKVVEPSAIVSALQVDNLGGLEVSLLDNLGNFSRNGSRYVPKPVSILSEIQVTSIIRISYFLLYENIDNSYIDTYLLQKFWWGGRPHYYTPTIFRHNIGKPWLK